MKLDDEIRQVREKYWETEKQAAAQMPVVLLVEGDDDRDIVEEVLARRARYWDQRVKIVVAGGRAQVIQRMRPGSTFPNAYGFVDRDTWSVGEVNTQRRQNNDRLYVTEGWCMENLFFRPDFLQKFNPQISGIVDSHRDSWLRAGAFWWATQRAREAQQTWQETLQWSRYYGTPHPDLDLSSSERLEKSLTQCIPAPVREDVRLDFNAIAGAFEKRMNDVLKLIKSQQWQIGVHGKCAFEKILVPLLETHYPRQDPDKSPKNWRKELASHSEFGRPGPF